MESVTGTVLGRRAMPAAYEGAGIVRAPFSDRFYLGGPEPGQVTRLVIPGR